ncbi:MAG: ComEC/Rec2 family competence protein [Candidatus Vogelbacteria bacterium]|nr:ComEC/Rec2 family competence protein [Candidatus Vogelbacteria bacterium]
MTRDRYFALSVAGFVLGIFAHSFFDFGWAFSVLVLIIGVIFLAEKDKLIFFTTAVFLISFGLGLLRYDLSGSGAPVGAPDQSKLTYEGMVDNEPDTKNGSQRFILSLVTPTELLNEKVYVYASLYPRYEYGDKLALYGELKIPGNISENFDWVGYLAKESVSYQMFKPRIKLLSKGEGNWMRTKLFIFKNAFTSNIGRVIPEPHSAFMGGLLLGAKSSLPEKLVEQFRITGVSHVVALSGYNITIVADTISKLLSFLPRTAGFAFGVVGIVLFTIMTGASATAVRAAIMALVVIIARASGRANNMWRALVFAGLAMLAVNPRLLVFDLSFQLSFLATLGIIFGPMLFEPKLEWITLKLKLREMTCSTLSAQLFVLPFILHKMGNLSLVALPVNLLILAFIPATMFFGFVTGITGFVSVTLSLPFAYISYLLLEYLLTVVRIFSTIPYASVQFKLPLVGMILLYMFLFLWVIRKTRQDKIKLSAI